MTPILCAIFNPMMSKLRPYFESAVFGAQIQQWSSVCTSNDEMACLPYMSCLTCKSTLLLGSPDSRLKYLVAGMGLRLQAILANKTIGIPTHQLSKVTKQAASLPEKFAEKSNAYLSNEIIMMTADGHVILRPYEPEGPTVSELTRWLTEPTSAKCFFVFEFPARIMTCTSPLY